MWGDSELASKNTSYSIRKLIRKERFLVFPLACDLVVVLAFVGLQHTVSASLCPCYGPISWAHASRAPHLLDQQSVKVKQSWTCVALTGDARGLVGYQPSSVARQLSNLLAARSLLSHSIKDAARDGPCAHGCSNQSPSRARPPVAEKPLI